MLCLVLPVFGPPGAPEFKFLGDRAVQGSVQVNGVVITSSQAQLCCCPDSVSEYKFSSLQWFESEYNMANTTSFIKTWSY